MSVSNAVEHEDPREQNLKLVFSLVPCAVGFSLLCLNPLMMLCVTDAATAWAHSTSRTKAAGMGHSYGSVMVWCCIQPVKIANAIKTCVDRRRTISHGLWHTLKPYKYLAAEGLLVTYVLTTSLTDIIVRLSLMVSQKLSDRECRCLLQYWEICGPHTAWPQCVRMHLSVNVCTPGDSGEGFWLSDSGHR